MSIDYLSLIKAQDRKIKDLETKLDRVIHSFNDTQSAKMDYIAMMAEVEIPEKEGKTDE